MNLKVTKSVKLIAVLFSGAFLLLGSATVDAGADKTINEGESVTLDGSKSTADDGATITAYTWSENGTVYCQNSQICTIDNLPAGIHHITLKITQSNGEVMRDDVTVTVNKIVVSGSAPVANDMNVTVRENKTKQLTLNASDPDGDALRYTIVTPPAHGKLSGTAPNLTYRPDKDYPGDDSFTYKVNDGSEDSNIATVSIDIKGYRLEREENSYSIRTYTYDTNGNKLTRNTRYSSDDYSTVYITKYINTYNAQEKLKRQDRDYGGDGTIDGYTLYTYDDRGNLIKEEDYDNDGNLGAYVLYTYDDQGNVLTKFTHDPDLPDDDRYYEYTYDAQGKLKRKVLDLGNDGTIDYTFTYSYSDTPDGGYIRIRNGDFTEKYDANGNIIESGSGAVYTWIEI